MTGWQDPDRAARLPRAWHGIRRRVFRRDGWRCVHVDTDGSRCDHVNRGDNPDNLQTLCADHHRTKTIDERPNEKAANQTDRGSSRNGLAADRLERRTAKA